MEPYQIVLAAAAILAGIIIIGLIISYNTKKNRYAILQKSFGRIVNKEMSYEEYESISHYFRNTIDKDGYYIDDITWNDLGMDEIFLMLNNTNSCVGRDYLYRMLRTPVTDEDELLERNRVIGRMSRDEKLRTDLMMIFYDIGFTRKISVSDYMDNLFKIKPASNFLHWFVNVCIVLSLLFTLFVDAPLGVALIIASCGFGIISYYKHKSRIDSYFECIRLLAGMVKGAKKICSINDSELSEYNERLNRCVRAFAKVSRGSFFVTSGRDHSGSLMDIIFEYVRIFTHIDLIKFNNMLRHIGANRDNVYELMDTLGYIEAMISIASFRQLVPYMCTPKFTVGTDFKISNVYHLRIKEPQANSISDCRSILITGSNASGKSTFLKSVAICAILAQTVYTCPADCYEAPFYRIYSSMALTDSIESGESYYIVEIKSLKRIVDAAQKQGARVLCFIDEVLRGTNTVERIAASSEILKGLSLSNATCFAATHDIELTHILEKYFANYHFTEEVRDGNIYFSYVIHEGRATSRNAIKLLSIMGYEDGITDRAKEYADRFVRTGVWEAL